MKNLSIGRVLRIVAAGAWLGTVVAGCASEATDPSGGGDTAQITVALTQVPSDVQCVELSVVGSSTVTQLFDVTAGQATTLTMSGLPAGPVTVNERAFATPCGQVTPTTAPSWVSVAPVVTTLVAGQSAGVTIVLRRSAQLVVTSDFQTTATGVTIAPTSQDFGSVPVGQTGAASFTVTNASGADIAFGAGFLGTNAAAFSATGGTCAGVATLATGASCSLLVQFAPTGTGPASATLSVGNPAQVTAALTGAGTQSSAVTISAPKASGKASFADAPLGSTVSAFITVTNGGTTSVPWAAALTGPDVASFALSGGTCSTLTALAAGTSCTLGITFSPFSVGPKMVTLGVGSPVVASSVIVATGTIGSLLPVSPASRDFGLVPVGQAVFSTFTVTNTGVEILPGGTPTILGPDAAQFAIVGGSCGDGSTLVAGATCTVAIQFAPTSTGAKAATFDFLGSGSSALTGTGTTGSTAVTISAPKPTGKGGANGTILGSTAGFAVTVTNGGTAGFAWAAALTGADVASYTLAGGTCAGLTTLAAGASCTVGFTFAPFTVGPKIVTLSVGNPVVASSIISLSSFVNGDFSVSPASQDFGAVPVGQAVFRVFTLTNASTEIISGGATPTLIGPDAAQFSIVGGTCGGVAEFAPGATCTLAIGFAPTTVGAKAATFDYEGAGDATLTGTGAAGSTAVTLSAPRPTGKGSANGTTLGSTAGFAVTVTNAGASAFAWGAAFGGADAVNYVFAGGTCATLTSLAAGASCTVGFTFAPFTVGPKIVTLSVGAPVVASSIISLQSSVNGNFQVSPASNDFGSIPVGQVAVAAFTVTNVSTSTISGGITPTLIGPDAAQYSIMGGTCIGVTTSAPGATCTIAVQFTPTSVGTKIATLNYGGSGDATLAGAGLPGSTAVTISTPKPTGKAPFTGAAVSQSTSANVTITNGGATALPFATVFGGPDASSFSVSSAGTCAGLATLAPAAACTLTLRFAPFATGTKVATFGVGSPVAASIGLTLLAGTGGSLALAPSAVTLATVAVGSSSQATLTVTNVATAAVPFSTGLLGPDASQFALTGGTCGGVASLAVGASCTLQVTFAPTSTGTKNAGLIVGGNQGAAALTGTGI